MLEDPSLAFTWEEILKLIDLARVKPRDYTLLVTMAFSGRRIAEIVGRNYKVEFPLPGLKKEDIDFGHKVIRWTIAKKFNKEKVIGEDGIIRKIHISRIVRVKEANPILLEVLASYIETLPPGQDKIFPITEQRAWQLVKRYMLQAGIERKRICHAFRHGFSIEFCKHVDGPEDIIELQQILDHARLDQTVDYLRFGRSRKRVILDKMTLTPSSST